MFFRRWAEVSESERRGFGENAYNRREDVKLLAAKELIRQVEATLVDARSRRFTFFACSMKKAIGSPIEVMFCDGTGAYFTRRLDYAAFCEANGIAVVLTDAIDIKIEVQSFVLNQVDIKSAKREMRTTRVA